MATQIDSSLFSMSSGVLKFLLLTGARQGSRAAEHDQECVAGGLVRYLRVDLHRECDPTVPENRHRDARVHVERSQQ
jgi:hypothetical protein